MSFKNKNSIKKLLAFCVIIISISSTFSQTIPDEITPKSWKLINNDSIIKKDYKELESLFYKNKQDTILSKLYATAYLNKAKKKKDSLKIADGYYFLSKICHENIEIYYLDSLISISSNLKSDKYPGVGYLNKGVYFYNKERHKEALKNYLIAQEYAKKVNNTHHLITIKHNIGLLKNVMGEHEEALKMFKDNLYFIKTKDTIDQYSSNYITSLFAISDSFHRLDLTDSATYYINKGLFKSYKRKDKFMYNTFLVLSGINNYLLSNYQKSLDSLYKAEKRFNKLDYQETNNLIYCYLQIAKVLKKMNEKDKSIFYLKKVDSLVSPSNYTYEKRKVFELLIQHFREQNDSENLLHAMSKLIILDSTLNEKNKNIKTDIIKKYDTAQLIDERNKIIQRLKEQKEISNFGLYIFISVSIVLLFLVTNYYRRQRSYKKKFEELIQTNVENKNTEAILKSNSSKSLDLDEEVVKDILGKLEEFEKNLDFLNPDIKMANEAKRLKTNGTYFSKVINEYKKKNFKNYVNDLRIEYCIKMLKNDRKFRLYSIESLGNEVGFNNVKSFTRAFQKKAGLNVSYFIQELKRKEIRN